MNRQGARRALLHPSFLFGHDAVADTLRKAVYILSFIASHVEDSKMVGGTIGMGYIDKHSVNCATAPNSNVQRVSDIGVS